MPRRGDDEKKPRRYCTGKRADGRPCRQAPMPGTTRCWHHSFRVPGRPRKLTPDLSERIIDAVLEGNYLETAAQVAGVNKTTLYRWLRRGDDLEAIALEHIDDDDVELADVYELTDPDDWVYLDFRHALKSAEAYAETELLRQARAGAPGWQAPMTVLERRHPRKWGRRDATKVTVEGELERTNRVEIVVPTDEERASTVAALLSASGALDAPEDDTENTEED